MGTAEKLLRETAGEFVKEHAAEIGYALADAGVPADKVGEAVEMISAGFELCIMAMILGDIPEQKITRLAEVLSHADIAGYSDN